MCKLTTASEADPQKIRSSKFIVQSSRGDSLEDVVEVAVLLSVFSLVLITTVLSSPTPIGRLVFSLPTDY